MFGDMLAERRRQLGYSISQASRVLRLREDVIIAFEECDFERMPKSGYAQGMLSSYARYLGLDASMVVEAYVRDFERYKREGQRRKPRSRSGNDGSRQGHVQPHVPSRGLLPTSGGIAGDMGSFATTRVRTRGSSANAEHEDTSADYTQVRPYTELSHSATPSRNRYGVATEPQQRAEVAPQPRTPGRRIETGYNHPQEPERRGSSSRRNSSRGRSASSNRASNARGGQRQGPRRGSRSGVVPPQAMLIGVIVIVVALALLLVLSIGSCVRREPSSSHTIPVSATEEKAATSEVAETQVTDGNKSASETDPSSKANDTTATSTGTKVTQEEQPQELNVAVSVTDGSVTWLEIECDGSSQVAETITGPWHKTYTVKESITIQAGDTSAVSVVRDGSQVQFESLASGLGTIRMEVPNTTGKDTALDTSKTQGVTQRTDASEGDASDATGYDESYGYGYDEYDQNYDYQTYDEQSYDDQAYDEESYGYDQY